MTNIVSPGYKRSIKIIPLHWIFTGTSQHPDHPTPLLLEEKRLGDEVHRTIEQRATTDYYTPYTFSAKERDLETGYSYFGARYYDPNVSVWLSVDPMCDKYPYQSGYCYVGWRPIMMVDPNGLWEQDADGNWIAKKGDSWWSLHQQSGMSWKETMSFAKSYNAARGKDNWKFVGVGDKVTLAGKGNDNSSNATAQSQNSSNSGYDNSRLPDDFAVKARNNSNSEYGLTFSINGCIGRGPGVMFDIGAVSDAGGDVRGYMTLGLFFGYGQSLGFGITGNNLSDVNDFMGFSSGAIITAPGERLGFLSLEGYTDIERGAEKNYYGTNYKGLGLNFSMGKANGFYVSYTLGLDPVDNATFFTRPGRR